MPALPQQAAACNQPTHPPTPPNALAQDLEGCTWVQVACRAAALVLRRKIIESERDEAAVVFYNTVRGHPAAVHAWGRWVGILHGLPPV